MNSIDLQARNQQNQHGKMAQPIFDPINDGLNVLMNEYTAEYLFEFQN